MPVEHDKGRLGWRTTRACVVGAARTFAALVGQPDDRRLRQPRYVPAHSWLPAASERADCVVPSRRNFISIECSSAVTPDLRHWSFGLGEESQCPILLEPRVLSVRHDKSRQSSGRGLVAVSRPVGVGVDLFCEVGADSGASVLRGRILVVVDGRYVVGPSIGAVLASRDCADDLGLAVNEDGHNVIVRSVPMVNCQLRRSQLWCGELTCPLVQPHEGLSRPHGRHRRAPMANRRSRLPRAAGQAVRHGRRHESGWEPVRETRKLGSMCSERKCPQGGSRGTGTMANASTIFRSEVQKSDGSLVTLSRVATAQSAAIDSINRRNHYMPSNQRRRSITRTGAPEGHLTIKQGRSKAGHHDLTDYAKDARGVTIGRGQYGTQSTHGQIVDRIRQVSGRGSDKRQNREPSGEDSFVPNLDQVDWESEYKRLIVIATLDARSFPKTFDMGLSVEDVVGDVLLEFFRSPRGLGWNPKKGPLSAFLRTRVKQRLVDHIRRDKKVAGSLDDTDRSGEFPIPRLHPQGSSDCEYAEFREQLLQLVGNDPDLRDLVACTEWVDGGANVNQQLSEILGKPVSEIVNLKRRLLKIPEVRACYEQQK